MSTDTPGPRSAGPEFQYVPLAALIPSKTNPRKTFRPEYITELAGSIRDKGILEPLIVRPHGDARFEIIAGECRYRGAKQAGIAEVPIRIKPFSDTEVLEVQLIENLHRTDLHPLEEADGYAQLMRAKYDVARIAAKVGRSPKYVYDRVKLLQLVKEAQDLFREDRISAGHAILLARLSTTDQRRAITSAEALFTHESLLLDPDEKGERDPKKARSVRELDGWIARHVRFYPERDADPMLFPETALRLKEANDSNGKVIPITHEYQLNEEARSSERTYGLQAWKPADGEKGKECEHSVLGVIVAGPGRGEAFDVCINKEKCKTHWAGWQREREKRATGQATTKKDGTKDRYAQEQERYAQQQAKEDAARKRWEVATPQILKAVAERLKRMPAGATGLLAETILADISKGGRADAETLVSRGRTAEDLIRFAAFVVLAQQCRHSWSAIREFPKRAKAFGVDVQKFLENADVVEAECKKCGCTEAKACKGGCAWAEEPDPKTGKGLCTTCESKAPEKAAKPKTTKKRPAAAARA